MEKTVLELAVEKAQNASNLANVRITELGVYTSMMYTALNKIQHQFDLIRNVPNDKLLIIEELKKTTVTWKQQVEKIEADYKNVMAAYKSSGAAGAGLGVGVVALGPTAAMGFATTFGVASTGTAISALSGAAATNAALAWLGGGALVAGGGGVAAGNALLAMAGPVGWGIAAVSVVFSGIFWWNAKKEKERLENIYSLISERDVKRYKTAIIEIDERIKHITIEHEQIIEGIVKIKTFGYDYRSMTNEQQFALGTYLKLMESSTQLLVNPILGLQPSFTESDYLSFCNNDESSFWSIIKDIYGIEVFYHKNAIIAIANLLYKVQTDQEDRDILTKSFKKNEDFLKSLGYTKDSYPKYLLTIVNEALIYKYSHSTLSSSASQLENTGTSVMSPSSQQEKAEPSFNSSKKSNTTLSTPIVINSDADIEETVQKLVAKACNMYPQAIRNYHNLSKLGVHVGTIAAQLENAFGVSIPADKVRNMHTVGDAIASIKLLIDNGSSISIERKVFEVVAKSCNMYPGAIYGWQNFFSLGVNVGSVAAQLENAFKIRIPAEYVRNMRTVSDAVDCVKHLVM